MCVCSLISEKVNTFTTIVTKAMSSAHLSSVIPSLQVMLLVNTENKSWREHTALWKE